MALDWSKAKRREHQQQAPADERAIAALLARDEATPSKAELRAQAADALARYTGRIRRLPTILEVRCGCGHRAKVRVPDGRAAPPRLRCSRCGSRAL
ncbi:MAG: hypothetical protein IT337_12440 [Thermomicrobiales bacterium]|nr:hypothetical protein [Thermomicrobiales bacterium]